MLSEKISKESRSKNGFPFDKAADDIFPAARIAESLHCFLRRNFPERIREITDHKRIKCIPPFKTSDVSEQSAAFFCSHIKCIRKRDRPVFFRLIEPFQLGKLYRTGGLRINSRQMPSGNVASNSR